MPKRTRGFPTFAVLLTAAVWGRVLAFLVAACTAAPAGANNTGTEPPRVAAGAWWDGFDRLPVFNGFIEICLPTANGMIAGGDFTTTGSVPARYIAEWDGTTWHAFGNGLSAPPGAILPWAGGVVVGDLGGVRYWDGAAWSALGPNAGDQDRVTAFAEYGGALYASWSESGLKRWNGAAWEPFVQVYATVGAVVRSLAVFDGKLIAAGQFLQIGTTPANGIAAYDGTSWSTLGGSLSIGADVEELLVTSAGLFVSGQFTTVDGQNAEGFAHWDGSSWTGLDGNPRRLTLWNGAVAGLVGDNAAQLNGEAWTLLPANSAFPMTNLVAVGTTLFSAGGVRPLAGASQYDFAMLEGPAWRRMRADGLGLDGPVTAMCVYRDTLVVAGDFGALRPAMLQWDGSQWHAFPHPIRNVRSLIVFEGDLIAGGSFQQVESRDFNSVARWNGAAWSPLGTGLTYQVSDGAVGAGSVYALCEFNGEIIAAGGIGHEIRTASPYPGGIARWDGTQWAAIGLGPDPEASLCLAVRGTELIAAGDGCPTSASVSRWDGTNWTRIDNVAASRIAVLGNEIYAGELVVECDGPDRVIRAFARWTGLFWQDVLIPGTRSRLLGTLRDRAVYANSFWDGTGWTTLPGDFNRIPNVAIEYQGSVYYGGPFTRVGSQGSYYIARWDGDLTDVAVEGFEAQTVNAGILLSWRISSGVMNELRAVHVERAMAQLGPFEDLTPSGLAPNPHMSFEAAHPPATPAWYRLRLVSREGGVEFVGPIEAGRPGSPVEFSLVVQGLQRAAGPIAIRYRLGSGVQALDLSVYDAAGRLVRRIAAGPAAAGSHLRYWDGTDTSGGVAPRGVYFVRLTAGGREAVRRIVRVTR